jgi:1,4-dihydroxy-2-naphthoate octaprenyltransferase
MSGSTMIMATKHGPPAFARGLWRLADPKISLASLASLALGTMAAAALGPIHRGWLMATVAAVLAVELAKNASGEVVDFDSGTDLAVEAKDRTPFSGGKRVLVDGLLTRGQTIAIAATAYAAAIAMGFVIASLRAPGVVLLGIVGVGCAYFYHGEPFKLAYRGLGELAVGLCYGPLICAGAFVVQRSEFAPFLLWLSVPLGVLIAAFLWINEFPDYAADLASGKRTLVVALGRERASRIFCALIAVAFALVVLAPLSARIPRTVWLGLLGLPFGLAACRTTLRNPHTTAALVPAQRNTLRAFVIYAVGAGLGLLIDGLEIVRIP